MSASTIGTKIPHLSPIYEDSMVFKAFAACVPIAGPILSLMHQESLNRQIAFTADAPRLIELIKVKNNYRVCNVINNMIALALLIAGVATGILSTGILGPIASIITISLLFLGLSGLNIKHIINNQEVIKELKTKGLRPGMYIS